LKKIKKNVNSEELRIRCLIGELILIFLGWLKRVEYF
jgi:hypothetical protein